MLYLDFSHHSRLAPSKIMNRLFHVCDASVRTVCTLWASTLRSAVFDGKDLPLIKDGATHRGQCSCHLVISQKRTDLRRVRTRLGRCVPQAIGQILPGISGVEILLDDRLLILVHVTNGVVQRERSASSCKSGSRRGKIGRASCRGRVQSAVVCFG